MFRTGRFARILRTTAVASAALLTTAVLASPAQADTRTFNDGGGHMTTVKVTNGSTYVTIKADVGHYRIGSYFRFWLDTDSKNAGPEYKNEVWPNSELMPLKRVGSFTSNGTDVRCTGLRASADAFSSHYVTLKVPRSCIKNPSKVRVSVRAYYDVAGPNDIDWAPAKHKFFGWVSQ